MDQFLYGLPVIGLVFEFVGYLIAILPVIAPIIMQASVPIAFAALCGVMCERSGVVNIGIEGTMLVAAFVGWAAGVYLVPVLGSTPGRSSGPRRRSSSRCVLAVLAGVVVSLVHAWLSISVQGRPDHQRHDHQHRRVRDHRLPDLAPVDQLARGRRRSSRPGPRRRR